MSNCKTSLNHFIQLISRLLEKKKNIYSSTHPLLNVTRKTIKYITNNRISMNFLEKLFGKKEVVEEKPVKINLDFDEIDAWFENETTGFLNPINQTIKNSFEQIESILKELNTNLENLEKAKPEEVIDVRTKKFALDNRIAFIRKSHAFTNKINFPDAKDTLHVLEFYNVLIKNTAGLLDETRKNIYFVNMLFAKKTAEITSNLKSIGSIAHESQKALQKDKNKIELI